MLRDLPEICPRGRQVCRSPDARSRRPLVHVIIEFGMISEHQNWFSPCRVTWRVESPTRCVITLRSTTQAQGRCRSLPRGAWTKRLRRHWPWIAHPLCMFTFTALSVPSPYLLQSLGASPRSGILADSHCPCTAIFTSDLACLGEWLVWMATMLSPGPLIFQNVSPVARATRSYQIILLAHLSYDR
jgi:hypothetical protein